MKKVKIITKIILITSIVALLIQGLTLFVNSFGYLYTIQSYAQGVGFTTEWISESCLDSRTFESVDNKNIKIETKEETDNGIKQ